MKIHIRPKMAEPIQASDDLSIDIIINEGYDPWHDDMLDDLCDFFSKWYEDKFIGFVESKEA